MSERSEPNQVCRRSALAFLGYAAAFGLVASSALLTASEAEAQATTTPATPTTPPTDAAKSGTERRQERRSGRAERRQERRTGRTERRQERRTGRDERRDARDGTTTATHRAKKVIVRSGQQRQSARLSAGRRKAATARPERRATGHRASRASAQATLAQDTEAVKLGPNQGPTPARAGRGSRSGYPLKPALEGVFRSFPHAREIARHQVVWS